MKIPAQSVGTSLFLKRSNATTRNLHLRAATVALGLAGVIVLAGVGFSRDLEHRCIHSLAPESSYLKDQGVVWQRTVFEEADLLPFYGSSELLKHFGNEPQFFFNNYPSNFSVSPTGRAGCTSLVLLQKVAAAGVAARGRKLALCLSPSWFFHHHAPDRWYAGNFSSTQTNQLIFGRLLSLGLKQDIARRMIQYPDTIKEAPLLSFAMHRLAEGGQWNSALYRLIQPLGYFATSIQLATDHFECLCLILRGHKLGDTPARKPRLLNWRKLCAAAKRQVQAGDNATPERSTPRFANNEAFEEVMQNADEWNDLELLLRVCRELGLEPLLLNIPMDSEYFRQMGVSQTSLDLYLQRLRALAGRYDTALVDFADHREDPWFLGDHHDHFSAKGWMFVNKELDGFFHAPAKH